ncbi:MAG: pentapeptide repeat-containing protein, partial [Cyanobacteria bacterium J06638_28]
ADLSRADLSRADLRSAYLFSAYLFSANLSSAYLRSADLSRADLSRADLSRANLSSADLSRADLFSAYLFSANLSRANLSSAYLSSANLANVQWDAATQWANARGLHEAINIPAALAETPRFAAAVVLSQGLQQVAEGDIPGAIQAYQTAQDRDATIPIAAYSWHTLCWQGCLRGYASEVLFAGDEAVKLAPDFAWWNHTRGLARAMTGDAEGAIDDFQTLVDGDGLPESMKTQARGWLEVLQQGQNPFTPEVLATLREDE